MTPVNEAIDYILVRTEHPERPRVQERRAQRKD